MSAGNTMPVTVPYAAIALSRVAPARVRPQGMRNCSSARSAARSRSFSAKGAAQSAHTPGHAGCMRLPDTAPSLPVKRVKRRVCRARRQQFPTQQCKAGPGHGLRHKTQQQQTQAQSQNAFASIDGGQLPDLSYCGQIPAQHQTCTAGWEQSREQAQTSGCRRLMQNAFRQKRRSTIKPCRRKCAGYKHRAEAVRGGQAAPAPVPACRAPVRTDRKMPRAFRPAPASWQTRIRTAEAALRPAPPRRYVRPDAPETAWTQTAAAAPQRSTAAYF